MRGGRWSMMTGWLALVLPVLLASDGGADATPAASPAPALIPRPVSRRHEERPPRIDLRAAKDGSGDLLYETSGFTARVAPDGSVTFKDKHISGLSFVPFLPKRAQLAVPSLQSSLKMFLRGKPPLEPPPSELDQGLPPPETTKLVPDVS